MKCLPNVNVVSRVGTVLLPLFAALCAMLPRDAVPATVSLASSPLASSTTTSVKPNLLFVLDDSGSMAWDHMPDSGGWSGFYGRRSSQCNQVYYNPAITYKPPLNAAAVVYSDSSFTAAKTNGFSSSSSTVDLRSQFQASQSIDSSDAMQAAYYFAYSGSQTTKTYTNTSSTFYKECASAENGTDGRDVFTRVVLNTGVASTTAKLTLSCSGCTSTSVSSIKIDGVEAMSGTSTGSSDVNTAAANIQAKITANGFSATVSSNVVTISGLSATASKIVITRASGNMSFSPTIYQKTDTTTLTNFANWYSFYRNRMLMMKTATGRAFSELDASYRVGLMSINASSAPVVPVGTFEGTADTDQRGKWYKNLYATNPSSGTPLREALAQAGRYFAGKLSGVADPIQYSCQQNFTILSTDGYWNGAAGYMLDGSTPVGTQDSSETSGALVARPYYDGGAPSVTVLYSRNSYSCTSSGCGSGRRLRTQPQEGSCEVAGSGTVTGSENCTPSSWTNTGTTTYGSCVSNAACSASIPSPNPSNKVLVSRTGGGTTGVEDTLADVAMYYYKTDLRTSALGNCSGAVSGEDVCTNNVFTSSSDNNSQQHMTTFTLGLGASGVMQYSQTYLTDTTGDYIAVKQGSVASSTVCTWQTAGTVCNWPEPASNSNKNIDDLWHAAVNGRGAYFSATDPTSLAAGLGNALAGLNARKGSAAAAATSTLNPVSGNNFAYVASYTTVTWKGNLEARGINTETGRVNENASWCVEDVPAGACSAPGTVQSVNEGDTTSYYCVTPGSTICMGGILEGTDCKVPIATSCTGSLRARVSDATDTRTIYTSNLSPSSPVLTALDSNYVTANPTYFAKSHISTLSQWSSLTTAQQDDAAANLVGFLRGRTGYEDRPSNVATNRIFRMREAVLGDAVESQPAYMGPPVFSYAYPGYTEFKAAQAGRAGSVFMGTNDGMMHSFNAATGYERWAYVPSQVISNMWKLADKNYESLHTNYVNGSPITTDICTANCTNSATAVWKTILIAGLNGGGRGYYALDITSPDAPTLLWELTTTTGSGNVKDDDVGYSFGQPIVTRKKDGTWVVLVTSGYNNVSPGTGKGFLYVLNAATGAIISKISTGVGDTTTPSGLAKMAAWNSDSAGNAALYVYGGDLLGNLWRFDINDAATAAAVGTGSAFRLARLYADAAGSSAQPVTTTPVLAKISGKRVIIVSTGKYLETSDLSTTQKQTIYALKDEDGTGTSYNNPRNLGTMVKQTLTNNPDGTATRIGYGGKVNFFSQNGWYLDLPDTGERVHVDSMLVQGLLLVPSTVPTNTACSPGGYGWLNFLGYDGLPAQTAPVTTTSTRYSAPIVGINVLYIQGQPKVAVVTSTNPTPTLDDKPKFDANAPTFTGKRVIWRELIQ